MISSKLCEALRTWAESKDCVTKLYLFGSRYRGDADEGSDIDLAVEIRNGDFTAWAFVVKELEQSLSAIVPYKLDLQWYGGMEETPTIHCALTVGSRVIYAANS